MRSIYISLLWFLANAVHNDNNGKPGRKVLQAVVDEK